MAGIFYIHAILTVFLTILVCSQVTASDDIKRSLTSDNIPDTWYIAALDRKLAGMQGNDSMSYYDSSVRPQPFDELVITGEFYLLGIVYVDEKQGMLGLSGILNLAWQDDRLKWDPEEYGGINFIRIHSKKLWLPDFIHSGHKTVSGSLNAQQIYINNNGQVRLIMDYNEDTPCSFDLSDFPHDTQMCKIRLLHVDSKVILKAGESSVPHMGKDLDDTIHHGAWLVDKIGFGVDKFENVGPALPMFVIDVSLTRSSTFFIKAYVSPICFLLLLIPIIFLLPADSTEKLTYGAILLFAMIFVSERIDSIFPSYSKTIPDLVQLNVAAGALLFLCILLTSILSSAERIGRTRPLPAWMKRYILGYIGPFLLVKEDATLTSHGTVHLKSINGINEADSAGIVQNEQQSIDFQEESISNAVSGEHDNNERNAILALVNELKRSRLQSEANEGWTNVFTVIDRLLFILTLFIAIVIIICFYA